MWCSFDEKPLILHCTGIDPTARVRRVRGVILTPDGTRQIIVAQVQSVQIRGLRCRMRFVEHRPMLTEGAQESARTY
jgi:hypothetical protein